MKRVSVAIGAAYVILLAIVAASSPHPARAARSLARENAYGAMIIGACLAAHAVVRRREASRGSVTNFLALLSAMLAVLNPALVGLFFAALGVRGIGGGGDSEMQSFVVGLVALTAGIIAAARIRRARGRQSGMRLAAVGIVGGCLWVAFWTVSALVFAFGMAAFR